MAIYKGESEVSAVDVWLHMRSVATNTGQFAGGETSYAQDEIKLLTEELGRIVTQCVDMGDAEVTGCDLELIKAIRAESDGD